MTRQRVIPLVVQVAEDPMRAVKYRAALASVAVAGAFCVAVALILTVSFLREQKSNPLANKTLVRLQAQLVEHPEDAALKEQIRQIDQELRADYFRRRAFFVHGAWLLLGGAVVLALAIKSAYRWGMKPYVPDPLTLHRNNPFRIAPLARMAVGIAAIITAGVLVGLAALPRHRTIQFASLLQSPADEHPPRIVAGKLPSDEEYARNWPSFRGPAGSARAVGEGYPTEWDGPSGRNVLWKSPVPLPGNSSPIVWGDRIFLTGATAEQREIFCYDAGSGQLLWRQPVGPVSGPPVEVSDDTSFAPNTPATDGVRVYAIFPTGDLAAFDFAGRRLWAKSLGRPDNHYGHASSLATWRDRLIVQLDQGHAAKDGKSAIIAFDGATGSELWRTPRPTPATWSSPIVAMTKSGPQIIASGDPYVMAYDPLTGAELWRAKCMGGEIAPSPVFDGEMVYVAQSRADLVAIRPDGRGDVTDTHIAWTYGDDLPDITSPLATGQYLLMVTTGGTLTCCDVKTGKAMWIELLDVFDDFNASPALAAGKVYLTDTQGVTYLFEPGPAYKPVGQAKLGEKVRASFAFVDGRIYVRGEKNLYCLGVR